MSQAANAGAGSTRCPSCGGLNPSDADWCGQCLKRFTAPPPPPPRVQSEVRDPAPLHLVQEPEPDSSRRVAPQEISAAQPPRRPPAAAVGARKGAFSVTEEGINWTCKACESENPMESEACGVCGSKLADTLRPPGPERPARDPNTTAMISLAFPGAGHGYLGLWPQAIARGVLQTWVVAAALIGAISGSLLIGGFFGLAAFVLWGIAAHDSFREASGQPSLVLLQGRAFLWVVLGLLCVLMISVVVTAMSAPTPIT